MPIASRILLCASTRNSCGRTCRISRSSGREMLRAASTARRTSSRSISRGRVPSVIPPRLFTPRTWLPATPMSASSIGTLATPSASSTARRMELTVASRFTIKPLRKPLDSAAPSARNFTRSPSISAMRTEVLVLPMSSPTRYLSFFTEPPLPMVVRFPCYCVFLFFRGSRYRAGVGVHDHLPCVLQINRLDPPHMRLPLREVVQEHFELARKIAGAEMDRNRLGINSRYARGRSGGDAIRRAGESGHDRAQVLRIRKVGFTDVLRRAAPHQIDVFHELLIKLHAFFALFARHFFGCAADDWKMQILIARAVEQDTVGVNQPELVAVTGEGDGRALSELDAQTIGENALNACGFYPRHLLEQGAAAIQRNANDTAVSVLRELPKHGFSSDNMIANDFDLLRL